MDPTEREKLAEVCRGLDEDMVRRVIDAHRRMTKNRERRQLRRAGERLATVGAVLRTLKFRFRTTSDLHLREPHTQTESSLAMAMTDVGLSYRHRERMAGGVADFWVRGDRGFAMVVQCTPEGRAEAVAMRRRGMLVFELNDRALAQGPLACARTVAGILNVGARS